MSSKPKPREAEPNFEGAMDRLEKIVEQMESGKLPLEDLIVRYEEGMNLVKICQERLANAEQKIEIITRNSAGKRPLQDFEPTPEAGIPSKQRSNPKTPMTKSNSSENPPKPPTRQQRTARLLDGIRSPADIKALSEQDLPQLAQEVRDELIKVLSQTGGHLGPNLGVVELTIALHRVFDTPRDRFVMDVSHQGYVHKMFTGRLDRFHTMRQFERPQRISFAHGKRTRLLRRRSCRHGAFRWYSAWLWDAICAAAMKTLS